MVDQVEVFWVVLGGSFVGSPGYSWWLPRSLLVFKCEDVQFDDFSAFFSVKNQTLKNVCLAVIELIYRAIDSLEPRQNSANTEEEPGGFKL